jgi:3'-5' exoribonuclease
MNENIVALKKISTKFNLVDISDFVLNNEKFAIWTASACKGNHHYGRGGLVKHTLEVVDLCLLNRMYLNTLYPNNEELASDKVFLAALYHDFGKIYDYKPVKEVQDYNEGFTDNYDDWQVTKHKKKIHHITRSGMLWVEARSKFNYSDNDDDILHAILAHHGMKEWGSPVNPKTRLAWLLHLCDSMSARQNDCYTKNEP